MQDELGYSNSLKCPWCQKGRIYADQGAKGHISNKCSECGKVYIADLTTGRTEKAKARASPNTLNKPTAYIHNRISSE